MSCSLQNAPCVQRPSLTSANSYSSAKNSLLIAQRPPLSAANSYNSRKNSPTAQIAAAKSYNSAKIFRPSEVCTFEHHCLTDPYENPLDSEF